MAEPIGAGSQTGRYLVADGERFLPGIMTGAIELEHLHRYKFAAQFCAKKVVLDIASGEGYGSALLARFARQVYGVDISAEAIESAKEKYQKKNLKFLVGNATKIPLANASIDVVVSFETIEHLADHEGMMREIKRVLRPRGTLVISSPDRHEFSDKPGSHNPYHVKELYREEFQSLLSGNFRYVRMFGQKILEGSVLFGEDGTAGVEVHDLGIDGPTRESLLAPKYLLALASDVQLPRGKGGILEGDPAKREAAVENVGARVITAILRAIAPVNSLLLRRKLTDPWYLQRNPDVASRGIDPVAHWLEWGAKEGRLPVQNVEGLARELVAEQEQGLRQTIEEKNQELRRGIEAALERQRILELQIEQTRLQAREEVEAQLRLLAERERILGEQLSQQQRLASEEREAQRQISEQRLQASQSEQAQRQEELRLALAEKERAIFELQQESLTHLHELEARLEQERSKWLEQVAQGERKLAAQLEEVHSKTREQLVQREREFAARLEQQRSEMREQLAALERAFGAQSEQIRSEAREMVEANLRSMIERERTVGEQLVEHQGRSNAEREALREGAAERLRSAAAQFEERESSLRAAIADKEREFRTLQRETSEQRKVLEAAVAQQRLAVTYATESHAHALAERDRELAQQIALHQKRIDEERAADRAATQEQLLSLEARHGELQERAQALEVQLDKARTETRQAAEEHNRALAERDLAFEAQLDKVRAEMRQTEEEHNRILAERDFAFGSRLAELQRLETEERRRQTFAATQELQRSQEEWLGRQRALEMRVEDVHAKAREQIAAQLRSMVEREQTFLAAFSRVRELVDRERRFLRDQYLHTARAALDTLDEIRRARWWHRIGVGSSAALLPANALVDWAALREHIEGAAVGANPGGTAIEFVSQGRERQLTGPARPAAPEREINACATTIAELIDLEGADFVTCAYLTFLGRRPDAQGFTHYSELLRRSGNKAAVIRQISGSEEARRRGFKLKGLNRYLRRERWKRVPVLGDLVAGIEQGQPLEIVRPLLEQIEQRVEALERDISGGVAQFEGNRLSSVSMQVGAAFATFDVSRYLVENPDIAASGMNPYEHFVRFGWYEGRRMPEADERSELPDRGRSPPAPEATADTGSPASSDDSADSAAEATVAGSDLRPMPDDPKWRCIMRAAPELAVDVRPLLTRLMLHIWNGRADLRRTFDIRASKGRLGFLKWLARHGTAELGLSAKVFPEELLQELAKVDAESSAVAKRTLREKNSLDQEQPKTEAATAADQSGYGANLVGYAYGEFGRGEDVRMVANSLHGQKFPFCVINQDAGSHGQRDGSVSQWVTEAPQFSTNVLLINADLLPMLPIKLGENFAAGRYNIGYWAWELSAWPAEFQLALDMVDEVWAISEFVAESVRTRASIPVFTMPNAVTVPKLGAGYTKERYGLPENSFVFYFIFDAASHIDRKNPIAVVRAFKLAFQGASKTHLLLKAMNIEAAGPMWDELLREVANSPHITLLTGRMAREEVMGLNLACDAFVSLHRSEGFGRCIAEAMAYGKPVIVTNYSGSCDFAREGTACLVDYRLIPVPNGHYPFSENQVWADPDVNHAAALMRRIAGDPRYREEIALAGQRYVTENFNQEVIGKRYAQRLAELQTAPTPPPVAAVDPAKGASVQAAPEIRGNVDAPTASHCQEASESLSIEGWAGSRDGIETVKIFVDSTYVADAHHGVLRPDIHAAFPEFHASGRSGYCYLLNIAGLEDGTHSFSVVATSRAGVSKIWTQPFNKRSSHKYQQWLRKTEELYQTRLAAEGHQHADVLVSVVLILPDAMDNSDLVQSLKSLAAQGYKRFEVLCFIANPAQERQLANAARRAKLRVKPRCVTGDGRDWAAIAQHSHGDLIGVLEPGDTLRPWALDEVVRATREGDRPDVLYGDEDVCEAGGEYRPVFKPGWSPIFLNYYNYIGRAWFVAREALLSALSDGLAGAGGLDGYGLLRLLGSRNATVAHVPTVLLTRVGHASEPESRLSAPERSSAAPAAGPLPKVSIIIPTRLSDEQIITKCFDGLEHLTDYPDLEVLVLVNNLPDPGAVDRLLGSRPFKVLKWDGAFSWSGINNFGAAAASGELLLFMNDDIEPLGKDWLRNLVGTLMQTGAGAAGCLLRYPNGTIQHAGVNFVNYGGGARHLFRFCTGRESSLEWLLKCPREVSAVTGACLLTSRECFEQLGGFDEELPLICNDTDYCLRVWSNGRSVVVEPQAQLLHYEGVSRAGMSEVEDVEKFWAKWGPLVEQGDFFSNPNLDVTRDDWAVNVIVEKTYKARIHNVARAARSVPDSSPATPTLAESQAR